MPCTGCGNTDYVGTVKLRYIGKKGDKGSYTHETGRIYTKPARFANKKAYPLYELVAVMPGTVIPDKYRFVVKQVDVPVEVELVEVPVVEDEPEPESDESVEIEEPVETVEEVVFIGVDTIEPEEETPVEEEIPIFEESESVSSMVDVSIGLSQNDILSGMDAETLKMYIEANDGKVDNRWGLKRLIMEAQKLQ